MTYGNVYYAITIKEKRPYIKFYFCSNYTSIKNINCL